MRRTVALWAAAVVGFALSAGCSAEQTGAAPEGGPLDAYLTSVGWWRDGPGSGAGAGDKQQEQLVAECMEQRGFTYFVAAQNPQSIPNDLRQGAREFAQSHGYGISDGVTGGSSDLNADYVASLPQDQQDAYYQALYGSGADTPSVADQNWAGDGCLDQAARQVQDSALQRAWTDPDFAPLFVAMDEFAITLHEHNPEVEALNTEWAGCMAEAGYPEFTSKEQLRTALWEEHQALGGAGGERSASSPNADEEAQFREREREVALTELDCDESTDYQRRFQAIDFAAQQKFVQTHREALEAMADKYGE